MTLLYNTRRWIIFFILLKTHLKKPLQNNLEMFSPCQTCYENLEYFLTSILRLKNPRFVEKPFQMICLFGLRWVAC